MREPDFNLLATRLLEHGIAPRHAHRTVNEIRDHYDDLVDAAVDEGATSRNARSGLIYRDTAARPAAFHIIRLGLAV